jgi:hypothetical protein
MVPKSFTFMYFKGELLSKLYYLSWIQIHFGEIKPSVNHMIEYNEVSGMKPDQYSHHPRKIMRIAIIVSGLSGLTAGACMVQAGH